MDVRCFLTAVMLMWSCNLLAADSMYCPQGQGYIYVGMSSDQIIRACGQPLAKQSSSRSVVEKIPITQLIYTTLNQGGPYPSLNNIYQRWSLPSGSTGTNLTITIRDNRISGITINGSSSNAVTLCSGTALQIGDTMNKAYSVCGTPSLVNQTYINQPVSRTAHPETWMYQVNPYQPSFTLTFINGTLQSIE